MKKNSIEDFIRKAKEVHGDKYDYSQVAYVNNKTHVVISCPEHGNFLQRPDRHLTGTGCPWCGIKKKKSLIRGVAINDTFVSRQDPAFKCWNNMLRRCYPKSEHEKKVTRSYEGCCVCDEWLTFSNFWDWYLRNGREGYHLDKDLFSDGDGKLYSPDTCCFLPQEINKALQCEHLRMQRGECKRFYNKSKNVFEAKLNIKGKTVNIGRFDSEDEAIKAYIERKEEYIKQLAVEYYSKQLITVETFYKLIKFKVHYANY